MSQVEILRPINPVDYDLSRSIPHSSASSRWVATNALVNDILSSSPLHLTTEGGTLDDHLFPDLPPLYHGHPEIHLRNGVINASQLAAQNVPDAEKAFFVGDLSQVYRQHQRWRACLPEVQPFYGLFLFRLQPSHTEQFFSQRSSATQIRTFCVFWLLWAQGLIAPPMGKSIKSSPSEGLIRPVLFSRIPARLSRSYETQEKSASI